MTANNSNKDNKGRIDTKKDDRFPVSIMPTVVGIKKISKGFLVTVEIKVFKGKFPQQAKTIRVKRGAEEILEAKTNANGETTIICEEPKSSAGKTIQYRILTDDSPIATICPVVLPEEEKKEKTEDEKEKVEDPEKLVISRHHDGSGRFTIFARVTKAGGIGIKTLINFIIGGERIDVPTDNYGNASFSPMRILNPGEIVKVSAEVSGIDEKTRVTLRRPQIRSGLSNRLKFHQWLLLVNNGRAVLFFGTMVVLWAFCWIIGWGDPILNPPATELTTQQKMYNETVYSINPDLVIRPEVSKGNWQKYFWLFTLCWTIFSPIYAIFSLREEIVEAVRGSFEKIMDRFSAADESSDPLYERIVKWIGAYSSARKTKPASAEATVQSQETEAVKKEKGITKWDLFKSGIFTEILVDLIPALLKIFKR